jgi:hypothetical protein
MIFVFISKSKGREENSPLRKDSTQRKKGESLWTNFDFPKEIFFRANVCVIELINHLLVFFSVP